MNKIRELRKQNNITQKNLCKKLKISQPTLSGYETGKHQPDNDTLSKIADYFKVSIDYLLNRETTIQNKIDINSLEVYKIPLVGKVIAGIPIETDEYIEGYVYINYKPANEYFALRVFGDSMINAGIKERTILICHKQTYANNGDIVVALYNGAQTVKYYKEDEKGNKYLVPANNNYLPIPITEKDEILILGKVKEARNSF